MNKTLCNNDAGLCVAWLQKVPQAKNTTFNEAVKVNVLAKSIFKDSAEMKQH